jgi:hypothetical protein
MSQVNPWIDKHINSWLDFEDECKRLLESKKQWVFRGQNTDEHGITTSFIRSIADNTTSFKLANLELYEERLISEFERAYHNYPVIHFTPPVINSATPAEWRNYKLDLLSLMQHYGAPTRLSDWTHSPYIALFFALDGAIKDKNFCVFALDMEDIENDNLIKFEEATKAANLSSYTDFTFNNPSGHKFIYSWSPSKKNERIRIQQGLFLVPSVFDEPLDKILRNNTMVKKGLLNGNEVFIRFKFNSKALIGELWEKLSLFNLTHETIFPGLDGFCKGLKLIKYDERRMRANY